MLTRCKAPWQLRRRRHLEVTVWESAGVQPTPVLILDIRIIYYMLIATASPDVVGGVDCHPGGRSSRPLQNQKWNLTCQTNSLFFKPNQVTLVCTPTKLHRFSQTWPRINPFLNLTKYFWCWNPNELRTFHNVNHVSKDLWQKGFAPRTQTLKGTLCVCVTCQGATKAMMLSRAGTRMCWHEGLFP